MTDTKYEYEGYYYGIPVWINFLEDDGAEWEGKNWLYEIGVQIMLWLECHVIIFCASFLAYHLNLSYEPCFQLKVRGAIEETDG